MANPVIREQVSIYGRVTHSGGIGPVSGAEVQLLRPTKKATGQYSIEPVVTDDTGRYVFGNDLERKSYLIRYRAFGKSVEREVEITDEPQEKNIDLELEVRLTTHAYSPQGDTIVPAIRAVAGRPLVVRAESAIASDQIESIEWNSLPRAAKTQLGRGEVEFVFGRTGIVHIEATLIGSPHHEGVRPKAMIYADFAVSEPDIQMIGGQVGVTLHRTASDPTLDQALWVAIRDRSYAISFNRYREFMNRVLRWEEGQQLPEPIERRIRDLGAHLHGVAAYDFLKFVTEAFLLLECGVRIGVRDHRDRFDTGEGTERLGEPFTREQMIVKLKEYLGSPAQLPYITRVVEAAFPSVEVGPLGDRLVTSRINQPCLIELIHTYWLEEGMLMQTMNVITQRFQNVRTSDRDPLANTELDPLRPLNNLLWGHIQNEVNRLSVRRRALEYSHQYGLTLLGKATGGMRPADSRSKFLEAFHNLLYQSFKFFKEDFQTTVIADGFPLLNALKEVHLILAQGAHNQFGDLPWTARVETLLSQFILARPEIRDFVQSRMMVPYKEPWMPQVDTMKTLQGWTDVSVTHFRDLAVYGEQLLLSARYGDWINVNDEDSAKNWARYWRPEIQGYLHAYRAAVGVDVTSGDNVDATIPAILLQRRLTSHQRTLP
jgi:hypothetical protein